MENDLKNLVDMRDRLAETELHAKEIRHRIKNQFNLLVSYIDLHSHFGAASDDHLSVVQAIRVRIETLARLHHQMSSLESGAEAPMASYLKEIATLLVANAPREIDVAVQGDEVRVDERILVPLSSILSELVTNSIKHAFDQVAEPAVKIVEGLAAQLSAEVHQVGFNYRISIPNNALEN